MRESPNVVASAPPAGAELERLHADHVRALSAAYDRILADTGWDAIVLHSGIAKSRTTFDDQYWPLRVTPHFAHWLPLQREDCALVIRPGARPTLLLNAFLSFWESFPVPETEHFWGAFDVTPLPNPDRARAHFPAGRVAFLGEDMGRGVRWGFHGDTQNPHELLEPLDRLRVLKTPYEIACLAEANRRAAAGHDAVIAAFRAGACSELELHLRFLEATAQDDPETPYKNIVAMGAHAAVLHHVQYGRQKVAGGARSLLVDAGATYQGYASDVTRTVVDGAADGGDLFGALIVRLEAMQQELCRRVAAGTPYERLHDQSHELLAPILRDLGLVRASDAELVASGATRLFLPHGLGHSLGLQTHDVGCAAEKPRAENPFLRNTSTVTVGQTFTIEPGCYFHRQKMEELYASPVGAGADRSAIETMVRFGGVRIEDDVLVTQAGARNLTREHLHVDLGGGSAARATQGANR